VLGDHIIIIIIIREKEIKRERGREHEWARESEGESERETLKYWIIDRPISGLTIKREQRQTKYNVFNFFLPYGDRSKNQAHLWR
jgi:hypothetical protein